VSKTLEINPQFAYALDLIKTTQQILFITGKAGTGKSTLLNYFCEHSKQEPVLLAPTGVAALNIKGQTVHSFFNFYIDVTPEKIINKEIKPRNAKLYKKLQLIIIDEASMMRADLLDCIDSFLRLYGPSPDLAFGGVQLVFVGDLYQLPPVVSAPEAEIFSKHYQTPYFFSAHVLENLDIQVIELEKVYRQQDQEFIQLLNRIRNNSVIDQDIQQLNTRYLPDFKTTEQKFYISLTTTNKRADEINEQHLHELAEKTHIRDATILGDFGREYYPTAVKLHFKVGSQIMLLNNDPKKRWVNGSIGVIQAIKKDQTGKEYIQILLQNQEKPIAVTPFAWEIYSFSLEGKSIVSKPIGTFTQYPFRLAWAVTIHKSQGKTFDNVIIDIGRGTFVPGQMYVGLSRCTSFEGIVLKTPIKKHNIRTDTRIYKFLTDYQYQKALKVHSIAERVTLIEQAIEQKNHLKITYLRANDTKLEQVIAPFSVGPAQYQQEKFMGMRGRCLQTQKFRLFHVGRILAVAPVIDQVEQK